MSFIAGILTFLLIANCLLLTLLVLVQLPKKDAGAGLAFGGGTADALFGAGSGNALTKITKYATIVFIVLAILLNLLQSRLHHGNASAFEKQVEQKQSQAPAATPPPATAITPAASPSTNAPGNNLLTVPLVSETNAPAK